GKTIILKPESIHLIETLLNIFENYHSEFEFYDVKYPSPSDPGAYFSYSFFFSEKKWKMTLGNHGWSGGIYTIENDNLLSQISDLIKSEKKIELKLSGVTFFSEYEEVSEEKNLQMNK